FGPLTARRAPAEAFLDISGLPARFAPELRKRSVFATSPASFRTNTMAKTAMVKIKLVSSADTGFYYVTKKNSRTKTEKIVKKKYDPVARKHVEFRESKIK